MTPTDAAASPWVTVAVTLILGVFGGGGLVALFRVGADRQKIVVEAAQGAVVVQSSVIEDLQEELGRLRAQREAKDALVARLQAEVEELRNEVQQLRAATADTASRVTRVEDAAGSDPG